jgi:hypothetical protein
MTKKHISPANTFAIEFDTHEQPGTVVAVQVTLSRITMRPEDAARIDLVDHPLYPALCRYVAANPREAK